MTQLVRGSGSLVRSRTEKAETHMHPQDCRHETALATARVCWEREGFILHLLVLYIQIRYHPSFSWQRSPSRYQ